MVIVGLERKDNLVLLNYKLRGCIKILFEVKYFFYRKLKWIL